MRALATFNANAPAFREASREHSRLTASRRARFAPTTSRASRARAPCSCAFAATRSRRCSSRSSSRRASSRRCSAGASSRRRRTSRRGSAASARSPTSRARATRWRPSAAIELPEQVAAAAAARLLRRVDREPRPAHGDAPRARLPRLRRGGRASPRPARPRRDGPAAEEGRQHGDGGRSAAARCTRSTCASAASIGRPRAPSSQALVPELEWAREAAIELTRWVGGLRLPRLRAGLHVRRTAAAGRVRDRARPDRRRAPGLDIDVSEYEQHFTETHVERSNALHSTLAGVGNYLVGPLARYALNRDELSPLAREAARPRRASATVVRNPFRSIVVRAVETVYAADEALRIIAAVRAARAAVRRSGAPRRHGPRLHRGAARDLLAPLRDRRRRARSSTRRSCRRPRRTRRRSRRICSASSERSLHLSDDELSHRCEQTIRNYDPCISCATHFLKLEVERAVRAAACLGSRYRGDDAVGPLVADRLRAAARRCSTATKSRPGCSTRGTGSSSS